MKAKGGARSQPAPAAAQQPPISPTAKGAKYRNRDGSKFITLPDSTSTPSSTQPSPTTGAAPFAKSSPPAVADTAASNGTAGVNRKKQKRREKERAKAAAAAAIGGASDSSLPGNHTQRCDVDPIEESDEADQFDGDSRQAHVPANGHVTEPAQKAKKSKKKKKKGGAAAAADDDDGQPVSTSTSQPAVSHGSGISRERIWNTSSQEERERIKEFWLGLGEDDRKSLVKVEKDAVLKKMKEQQKHTCSCSVCGRKRTAIEEELEGLYDAYYEELEQFANHPQQDGHPPMMGSSRHFGFPPSGRFPSYAGHQPSRGRIVEHVGDDDEEQELDEPYSDEEIDDEAYSDDEPEEEVPRDYAADFFNFGSSLTVQGGILTVADDLLKNDGKKFIEMMEQLAERRMAREVDSAQDPYARSYGHGVNGGPPGHDHPAPPPVDEEEYEDDDDEDYDSQEDDEYEEDDDDTMTEEQRMEEGRRMFQIFAARMFEQRVLQAYREKVARERQAKLMEEEEEELRKEEARKEKKAKEAQKKKEKAAQKKAAAAEEKARKEAERAAEEAARRHAEAEKAEEARRKAEEKRKKREAQKKEEDEERARKEAERQRQRQLHAEQERKAKESKEREKKAREERLQKEKEAREQKERDAKELKEKEDASKRQKERDMENKASKTDAKASQKQKQQEERAAKKAAALAATATPVTMTLPKRPVQPATNPALPVLPQQHPTTTAASSASPRPAVTAPALPKAPTPVRPRQTSSQQDGISTAAAAGTSLISENAGLLSHSPTHHTPAPNSPGLSGPPSHRGSVASHHSANASHTISPLQPNMARFPPNNQLPPVNMPPTAMSFPPGLHTGPPGFASPMFAPVTGFRPPPGMAPPGLSSPLLNRGFPAPVPPPGFHQPMSDPMGPFGILGSKDTGPSSHSRQPSGGGFESPMMHAAQPIGRPTPIGRPASIVQGQRPSTGSPSSGTAAKGGDDPEDHLGSSALLDDSEDVVPTLPPFASGQRRSYAAPGRSQAFPSVPFGDPGILSQSQPLWSSSPIQPSVMSPFGQSPAPPPGLSGPGGWPIASPIPGFSAPIGIGRQPGPPKPPASVVRQTLCQVCRDFYVQAPTEDGFVAVSLVQDTLKDRVEHNPLGNGPITEKDILALCETEGTMINGGGTFDIRDEANGIKSIRWNQDKMPQTYGGGFGAPGQLTSPNSSFSR